MVQVAIAGASTGIGRTIVDGLKTHGEHTFIILSRTNQSDPATKAVDYTNIDGLVSVLERYNIDTVISAISISNDASGKAQLNLIEAASRSKWTRRFLPSEFGSLYRQENILHVPSYKYKFDAVRALEATELEYSLISIGFFLDYWGAPRIQTYLTNTPSVWIDLASNFAAIPGDGDSLIALTHSRDVGKTIPLFLKLPKWRQRYYIIGSRTTLNEVVRVAERIKGTLFEVHYDDRRQLEDGNVTLTPQISDLLTGLPEKYLKSMKLTLSLSGLSYANGYMDLDSNEERTLNEEFPFIKFTTVEDVCQAWAE